MPLLPARPATGLTRCIEFAAFARRFACAIEKSSVTFEIVGPLTSVRTIAVGNAIREIRRLRRTYGFGHWRKKKGTARVRLHDGTICSAEVHWYEAHGIGKKEFKLKRLLQG